MKRKIFALLLCMVFICTLSLPVYADSTAASSDGYSVLISDIPKTCPTCGGSLSASWASTSGAEVEVQISESGSIKIPAGAGSFARVKLRCKLCEYEKSETRLLGLDFGNEKPGNLHVEQAPSGIGRKDLPGYADDNGTPAITSNGELFVTANCVNINSLGQSASYATEALKNNPKHISVNSDSISSDSWPNYSMYLCYEFTAPVDGTYSYYAPAGEYLFTLNILTDSSWKTIHAGTNGIYLGRDISTSSLLKCSGFKKGDKVNGCVWIYYPRSSGEYIYGCAVQATGHPICIKVIPLESNKQTTITINNNTWNGNIYTDNSTNLTYIYPQYTTINEKNETVTNISNTPIIYNNETKQYYTYDQTTKNYYYITYNAQPTPSPSPSPSESPTPTPTPDPGTAPTSTPKPGGSISTPETGKPGGSSGSSWWDKLLDKIGNAVIDGLLGAVSAVLKLIFKLFSTILGWIIWAVSLVFTLFPFLPPGVSGLLVGGVVVCFIIGIIKFIRG